jgi:uncharacterized membrane protein YraQ (UPF0718 family)
MEIVYKFAHSLIELSNAMAPYILFGLIFAGILHELVPQTLVTKHLGKENIFSVIKATLFGIPLPVCSCGVIPLATSIKKSGASKGATLSFLISTPITGVDSILATYGMFGWIFTLYRIFTSMIIAIVSGIITNVFDKEVEIKEPKFSFANNLKPSNSPMNSFSTKPKNLKFGTTTQQPIKKSFSLKKALNYSFVSLLGDIAKPLFWGLILGAAITTMIPQNLSDILTQYTWISYILAISIAIPMYVCATASLPIAAALMLSGVSPGAAFVFLSAGPATNIVTAGVVRKMLGSLSLWIYLGSIAIGSIVFGLGLDYIFDIRSIDPKTIINIEENANFITILSSIFLWGSILYFLTKPYIKKLIKVY